MLCQELSRALSADSFATECAQSGRSGLRAFFRYHPDLVLLDAALPEIDGWTVLRRIREITDIPVLVLASGEQLAHRLRALQMGAQDYMTRTVSSEEIVLRVRSALRRHALRTEHHQTYDDGVLRVDTWIREVTANGQPLELTRAELSLLACLVRQPGQVVTYRQLHEELPWLVGEGSEAALRSLLHRLRRKLAVAAPATPRIVSHRSIGLRLAVAWPPVLSAIPGSRPAGEAAGR